MKILVLHNNYPAQFKFIVPALISLGHQVVFLSLESHGSFIKHVKHYKIGSTTANNTTKFENPYKGFGKKVANAEVYRAAFSKLKNDGFYPDLAIFHSGWGIGYFLKSIFPNTITAAYAEWWYQWDSVEASFDSGSPFTPSRHLQGKVSHQYLNSLQASELAEADYIWSPTCWQRKQFPVSLQKRIHIIHEGVDTKFFSPIKCPAKNDDVLHVTYTSRALEPMRCFHNFVEIISRVMVNNKKVCLTIVGKDQPVYRPLPKGVDSLGGLAVKQFSELGILDRVTKIERLGPSSYKDLLANSDLHVYFSRPFIASWSLLEAMSSGCSIVSNPLEMTKEFLSDPLNGSEAGYYVNCLDYDSASQDINNLLESPSRRKIIGENARYASLKFDYRDQLVKIFNFIDIDIK